MALTMRRALQISMGCALALLLSGGVAIARIPAQDGSSVSANMAKNAQAAAKSAAQTASQTNSQTKPQTSTQAGTAKTHTPNKPTTPQAATAAKQTKPATAHKKEQGTRSAPPAKAGSRRDPFVMLVGRQTGGEGSPLHLPPGKAGLQVSTLILQGIVSAPSGMIAIVANPQKSVYFLHPGDALFDGSVVKIEPESVTFHEVGKDAFGKPLEHEVTKKLHPSSGEQP